MELPHPSGDTISVHSNSSRGNDSYMGNDDDNETLSTFSHTSKSKASGVRETTNMLQKDKWVIRIRVAAVIVMLMAAVSVSCVEYFGLVGSEQLEFEHRYEDQAEQLGHALQSELGVKLRAMDSFSVAISSYSMNGFVQWPNISLPEFEFRAATALTNGGGLSIGLQPLVHKENLKEWEEYSIQHQEWRTKGLEFQHMFPEALQVVAAGGNRKLLGAGNHSEPTGEANDHSDNSSIPEISQYVFKVVDGIPVRVEEDLMMPVWQYSPIDKGMPYVNYDQYSKDRNRDALTEVVKKEVAVLGPYFPLAESFHGHDFDPVSFRFEENTWTEIWNGESTANAVDEKTNPHNNMDGPAVNIWYPVFSELGSGDRTEVGILSMTARWDSFFLPHLPPNPVGLMVVMTNACSEGFTFEITGDAVTYLGTGDFHDSAFESYRRDFSLTAEASVFSDIPLSATFCPYMAAIYPSQSTRDSYETDRPINYTIGVACVFLFTIIVFISYDHLVERRQRFLADTAEKTHVIVSAMFPKVVRDRLFDENNNKSRSGINKFVSNQSSKSSTPARPKDTPIADLYTNTTVMFGDISRFTAWSSTRQPTDVFILLETLYGEFDRIARDMDVFKVETIGDCYVAVTGLPNPRHDHHLRMIRFARQALTQMSVLTRELEVRLGPDTTMLGFRVGLNSGPVTAGVLRGERSRFQLFGDTVNTASRMESAGAANRIHIAQATADLVIDSGKGHWLRKRDDLIEAKGKGEVQTYWVKGGKAASSTKTGTSNGSSNSFRAQKDNKRKLAKQERVRQSLIDWQVELLSKLIKQIVGLRKTKTVKNQDFANHVGQKLLPREEIAEHIHMPPFDPEKAKTVLKGGDDLPDLVTSQLKDLISTISSLYHNNSFHNFDHASHVTMSANKLLQRIVTPAFQENGEFLKEAHEYTFGLTSDPLTQFAILFSTIIHDLDHSGVGNPQLVKEKNRLAAMYGGKSVAEQNSIDLALELLTSSSYSDLLSCICADDEDFQRFRQLVINCVMATDIFDKELLTLRNNRWKKAFSENDESASDLKATIVIEHIIQAADVAHTMQHWHVYQKWNEKLFFEMRKAYESGRGGEKDPADTWYNGELWFFDNYVIPLAKKLDDCGVFGVCSDECLTYAKQNRKEWEVKGRIVVEAMCKKYRDEYEIKEGIDEDEEDDSSN
ncbi:unnamed protein product [Cylindrotheca closterium]|uniref:Phosphodiesterase n=1 Tax=Cylindrotheca closterium TaxID=2856 RepID=A0AAD2G5A6_9STRA|nr:unnamed protein product [Cylindrotheca closterium]